MRHETNRERVEKLMVELGRAAREPGRIYFTGGVSAVLIGWREMTMDVDLKPDPEPVGIFEALARLKEEIEINIELASPDDSVPALPFATLDAEIRLHRLLAKTHGDDAYGRYNALLRRLASFTRALDATAATRRKKTAP